MRVNKAKKRTLLYSRYPEYGQGMLMTFALMIIVLPWTQLLTRPGQET